MPRVDIQNNIYFICRGTSTNDIIDSINENNENKKTKSFFDIFNSKKDKNNNIKKEEFSLLDNIGINELRILGENDYNKILLSLLNLKSEIYTSLEYSAIESTLIITKDLPNITIYPLSYMSNQTNIKNKELLYILKNKFGNDYIKNLNITHPNNYWKDKIKAIDNNYINIKNIKSIINWNKLDKNISSLNSYNINKIKDFIKEICIASINNLGINNNVIVADGKLIEDILKLCKDIKFNKKRYTIERSSIWEVSISGYVDLDVNGYIIASNIKFNIFKKIYPTEYNYKPLKHNGDIYSYEYKFNKYILFNSMQTIPIKYIKNMDLLRLSEEKKVLIKKILNKKKNNNKIKNNNISKPNKNEVLDKNKKFKFELS